MPEVGVNDSTFASSYGVGVKVLLAGRAVGESGLVMGVRKSGNFSWSGQDLSEDDG